MVFVSNYQINLPSAVDFSHTFEIRLSNTASYWYYTHSNAACFWDNLSIYGIFGTVSPTRPTTQPTNAPTGIFPIPHRVDQDIKDYFQKELLTTDISNFQALKCNIAFSGEISSFKPVDYYIFNLTSHLQQTNSAGLSVSTCCNDGIGDSWFPRDRDFMYYSTFTNAYFLNGGTDDLYYKNYDSWLDYCNTGDENETVWDEIKWFYNGFGCGESKYCDQSDESLDTFLYLIEPGKYNLFDIVDRNNDVPLSETCKNTEKSMFDLSLYDPKQYIIAVSGYYNETGKYQIMLNCDGKYSYTILEDEINPTNVVDLSCGLSYPGININKYSVSYYKFRLTYSFTPFSVFWVNHSNFGGQFDFSPMLYLVDYSACESKIMQKHIYEIYRG
eukprot:8205_1